MIAPDNLAPADELPKKKKTLALSRVWVQRMCQQTNRMSHWCQGIQNIQKYYEVATNQYKTKTLILK